MSKTSTAPRAINLPTAIAIVVANMVGTGVFTSLGFQVGTISTGFTIVLLWSLGGVISLCGALCYAELGAMMPRSGGEYHLLREAFHPAVGFLAGWVSITVGFAAPIAAAAVAFAEFMSSISAMNPLWFSVPIVVVIALIHLGSLTYVGGFQLVFTVGKVILILIIIVAGFLIKNPQDVSFWPQAGDGAIIRQASFATSLVFVMYAYAGWNAAAYVAGEIKNPQKNLPLALLIGTCLVSLIYVALNAAFMYATPIEDMVGHVDVWRIAALQIFGSRGGMLMGLLISFGLVSTISSMTWTGPRVAATMGEDYRLFAALRLRNRFGVPAWAVLIQTVIVLVLVVSATFEQLINYIQAILILSSQMTVLAVVWLRFKRPQAERPYRVYALSIPVTIFTLMSCYMLYYLVKVHLAEVLFGIATLSAGGLVYDFTITQSDAASEE